MNIHWEKVLTDPLGYSGFALFLIMGIVTWVVKQKKPTFRWIVPTGVSLAVICAVGGLVLAYVHESRLSSTSPLPSSGSTTINQTASDSDCSNVAAQEAHLDCKKNGDKDGKP